MYFDLKEIYQSTNNGLAIFEYYFGHEGRLTAPNFKFKIRSDEKTASARISYFNGIWRITDFGNQSEINGLSPVDWIMYREGLQFQDALKFINEVILHGSLQPENFKATKNKPEYSSREFHPDIDKLGEYTFFYRDKATEAELKAIGRYVTQEIFDQFHCKTIDYYEYTSRKKDPVTKKATGEPVVHIFKATEDYPMYIFDYGSFKKLYKPKDPDKSRRFLYIGDKPDNYIFGLDHVLNTEPEFNKTDDELEEEEEKRKKATENNEDPDEDDEDESKEKKIVKDLFRCSGESDAMNMASLGFNVYWLNSESAVLNYEQYREIDQYCERHYQVMDLDKTGKAEAEANALKFIELFTIELPEWIKRKRDWRGNPCKDLKDFINLSGSNREETRKDFIYLKSNALRAKFWFKSKKDSDGRRNINLVMENYYYFLKLHGYYRIMKSYDKKADYMYIKLDGKVFRLISPSKIKAEVKDFTKRWIKGRKMMNILPLLEKINTSQQIKEANLESLEVIEIEHRNAKQNLEWLHFQNGMSMKITPDGIKLVRQEKEVPNLILGALQVGNKTISHILPHNNMRVTETPPIEVNATPEFQKLLDKQALCKTAEEREGMNLEIEAFPETDRYTVKINDNDFYFVRFLRDLARIHWRKSDELKEPLTEEEKKEENLALANLLFVYGYLCSEYKDPGKAWITITMDNKISEVGQSSGRSGKSLKTMAVRYVRPTFVRGGRDLDNADNFKFIYDGFTEFHNNIEIDDFAEYGMFDKLYTQITGAREINPKNYAAFTLEYKDSGKMSLSTNFEPPNTDSSTHARILYESASDYFHERTNDNDYKETRKPDIKYGRRLYEDFTEEDWMKFYNIIAYCIQMQMRFYKINPPMGNIERRNMRREMQKGIGKTDDFFSWANTYFVPKPESFTDEIAPAEYGYFDCFIVKEYAYEEFTKSLTSKQKNDYRAQKFKEHVRSWCRYYGFQFNPEEKHTDHKNKRITKSVSGTSKECFYIVSKSIKRADIALKSEDEDDLPEDYV